jgi:hypothetical protein
VAETIGAKSGMIVMTVLELGMVWNIQQSMLFIEEINVKEVDMRRT